MKKIIIASAGRGAGKTLVTAGLMKALGKGCGYIKPLGNRLVYKGKKVWDYDAALIARIFGIESEPGDLTIGFEHAKIRYLYSRDAVKKKVKEISEKASKGRKNLFIEGGSDLKHGAAIGLDPISVAKYVDGKVVLVLAGDAFDVMDDVVFYPNHIKKSGVELAGVIVNKVHDTEEFKTNVTPEIKKLGVKVLGILPVKEELAYFSVEYLSERMFSRNLTGEAGLSNVVKNVYVGDMSATSAQKNHGFRKENKLVITSGDRSDMMLAAIESDAACIVATNNITPHTRIISKAMESGIPVLQVPTDTYTTAVNIRQMELSLSEKDTAKIELLARMVKQNVSIKELA
ncbi:MAG: phosphotransacetylase family protein [Candidatus Altiarchaeota archaeon]|nr:phosphotransacetylase family protein [Candidatus Altiarchaeota archaeon]